VVSHYLLIITIIGMKMKKFLLGTTALISMATASSAFAGGSNAPAAATPANTGGLTVMVGGKLDVQGAFTQQDLDTGDTNSVIRDDAKLNFTAAGSTENYDYGAVVQVNANNGADKTRENSTSLTSGNTNNTNADTNGIGDKAYLFLENDNFGRFEAGANSGASQTLDVNAAKIARATGGVDGDWRYSVKQAAGSGLNNIVAYNNTYITHPSLPVANDDNTGNGATANAEKVTYYTPRFAGVQLGVSFTPDTQNLGSAGSVAPSFSATNAYENVFAGGLNYEADVEGVGIMASAIGENGTPKPTALGTNSTVDDLNAYSLGLGLEFQGFSIAGNWADEGKSGQLAAATSNTDSSYWTLGGAYENGPYGVSLTYMDSEKGSGAAASGTANTGTNRLDNWVVGADYQMAPGLTPYVEASFFDLKNGSTNSIYDNSGNVVLVGAEVAF